MKRGVLGKLSVELCTTTCARWSGWKYACDGLSGHCARRVHLRDTHDSVDNRAGKNVHMTVRGDRLRTLHSLAPFSLSPLFLYSQGNTSRRRTHRSPLTRNSEPDPLPLAGRSQHPHGYWADLWHEWRSKAVLSLEDCQC
ncbi:hypothetical protein AMTR_s00015p00253240 [Amborella trichopoda]|uniref:Uncharacterized protein n=1 Tax=Amborella trichopoda TaxID=13333 RepID=W1PG07_AMBTC|nr:hypothetical protein AMTR_s00015p00253240 [Amborella trichopoda]